MKRRTFLANVVHALPVLHGFPLLGNSRTAAPGGNFVEAEGEIRPHDEAFWNLVREQFPLTQKRIYLNNGGLGPSPYVVLDALQSKIVELERISETGHSEKLWHELKEKAARVLGATPEEIAFTRNATEGINIVCNGLPLKRGDEVVTTSHEHVGNTITWLARQKRDGTAVRVFEPSTQSADETLERLVERITPKTRVISIPHVTTTTGQILPVKEIGEVARRRDLWYFVDGAQAPGMMPVNVREIGCHAYATSGHKWLLGPKGTGLLYVRQDALDRIEAKWVGAYSNVGPFDIRTGEFQFHPSARRYEYGTVNVPLVVGLGAAMDFLLKIGLNNVWRRDHALATALKEGLLELGVEVLSPANPREHSAMMTFRIPGVEYRRLQSFLAREYALRTRGIYEAGLNAVRVSLHIYNSFEEVEAVLTGVAAARQRLVNHHR